MNKQSSFIVIEGVDGSGKSTLVQALGQYFESKNILFRKTKEPNEENPYGKKIYSILKSTSKNQIDNLQEHLKQLYKKDRIWNITNNITPALKQNLHIIQDRYYISTAAYQSQTPKEAFNIIQDYLNDPFFIKPTILFFLNLPVNMSLKRIHIRESTNKVHSFEHQEKLKRIYEHYQYIFEKKLFSFPVIMLDASLKPDQVLNKVIKKLDTIC